MAKTLIIVESPAKVKTISKFLGRQYTVRSSVGHIRDLPKSQLGVDVENHFAPKYITIRGKGDLIKELKDAAKKSDKVLLATDPDREGEAISWHLSKILNIDEETDCRIAFNEITESGGQERHLSSEEAGHELGRCPAGQKGARPLGRIQPEPASVEKGQAGTVGRKGTVLSVEDHMRQRTRDTGVCGGRVLDHRRCVKAA